MGSVISVFYVLLTVGKRVWGMRGWGGGVGLGGRESVELRNCMCVETGADLLYRKRKSF